MLAQLEAHLRLHWVYEAEPPAELPSVAAVPVRRTLNDESVAELTWLARIGDLGSLRRGIDRIEAENAASRAECAHLRGLLDQVELEGFLKWLRQD